MTPPKEINISYRNKCLKESDLNLQILFSMEVYSMF